MRNRGKEVLFFMIVCDLMPYCLATTMLILSYHINNL